MNHLGLFDLYTLCLFVPQFETSKKLTLSILGLFPSVCKYVPEHYYFSHLFVVLELIHVQAVD